MIIPGSVISVITFPGVIVHELAHQLFCRLSKVAVIDVCYFRFGNPAGYVRHEIPKSSAQHVLISVGPFIVNTIIGCLITLPASIQIFMFKDYTNFLYLFLAWLGVSIVMHSFPSIGDAKAIWEIVKKKETNIFAKIIGTPLALLILLCSLGSIMWLDLLFGIGVALFIPKLLISILA